MDSHQNNENQDLVGLIYEHYITHLTKEKKQPKSVEDFCDANDISKEDFYEHFHSFSHIERSFWEFLFNATTEALKRQDEYEEYGVKDKVLAFFFTWIEVIRPQKAFIEVLFSKKGELNISARNMSVLQKGLEEHFAALMKEGEHKDEVAKRFFFNNVYPKGFWGHFIFITNYWIKDKSEEQEKTDVAIEKSVQMIFDMISPNILESVWDFGKFVFRDIVDKRPKK